MALRNKRLVALIIGLGLMLPSVRLAQASDSPPPPPNRGTPETDGGTGSRGSCIHKANFPPFAQLVRSHQPVKTLSPHPTLWVFVPYTRTEAPSGEFSLQAGEQDLYRVAFELPETPGLVSVTLPTTVPALAVGQSYRWYFDIDCPSRAGGNRLTPASVTGLIQRVAPTDGLSLAGRQGQNSSQSIRQALDQADAYRAAELWLDAVTTLAELRQAHPNNRSVTDAWSRLLGDRPIQLQPADRPLATGEIITNSPPK